MTLQKRIRRVALLMLLGLMAYEAFNYIFPIYRIRYALTIDVLAGGRVYTNTSVIDVTIVESSYFRIAGGPLSYRLNSYCPSINLGSNGIMFVANSISFITHGESPKPGDFYTLPFFIYKLSPAGDDYVLAVLRHQRVQGDLKGKAEVPLKWLPLIARFRDLDDPESLEELDPNDLSSAYGPGSKIVRASLRITDDTPSAIPKYWPAWLKKRSTNLTSLPIDIPVMQDFDKPSTVKHILTIQQVRGGS